MAGLSVSYRLLRRFACERAQFESKTGSMSSSCVPTVAVSGLSGRLYIPFDRIAFLSIHRCRARPKPLVCLKSTITQNLSKKICQIGSSARYIGNEALQERC